MPMDATEVYTEHRGLLFGVAYRVLGRVADAEDVVQEAWLRWHGVDGADIADPKAYLVTVVTRLAIDRLRLAQTRHESYVGEWLPEPLLTEPDAAETAELADSVSLAMLVVLETLSPLERVVFVLREAFSYSYTEIADVVERNEPAVRQLASRARAHVDEGRPRFDTDPAAHRRAAENFVSVASGGDVSGLLTLLAPDVELRSDGGGVQKAPLRTIVGADKVSRFLTAIATDPVKETLAMHMATVNGTLALVATTPDGRPFTVLALDLRDGLIQRIYLLANPEKLTGVADVSR